MSQGCFISLEGIEGVGKSSQIEFIRSFLAKNGVVDAVVTREPGGTPIAEAIRKIFITHHAETMVDETEFLLLFAGRAQHIENLIKPSLQRGAWVICDRYVDSSYAYQGAGRHIPQEVITRLTEFVCKGCMPDLTLLFDAPVALALSRTQSRGSADRVEAEDEAFFERIRAAYLARAAAFPERFRLIDASVSPEQVQAQIESVLIDFLEKKS